jgi:hypothetical protein
MEGCGAKFRGLGALLGALGADGSDDTHIGRVDIEAKYLGNSGVERYKFEEVSVQ